MENNLKIKSLTIGQMSDMKFVVGLEHKTYGLVEDIEYAERERTCGFRNGIWQALETDHVYCVHCSKDGKRVDIEIEAGTPSLIVIKTEE